MWLDALVIAEEAERREDGTPVVKITLAQIHAELSYFSPYRIRTALDNLVYNKLVESDETEQKIGLRKRKLVSYALTEKGYALMHPELKGVQENDHQ